MSTTKVGVLLDALVSVFTNAGLKVVDGSPARAGEVAHDVVYVGWDGSDPNADAAHTATTFAGIAAGACSYDEALTVTCYAEATRGDGTTKQVRDAALALVVACEAALRADLQLAGAFTGPDVAEFGEVVSLAQPQTSRGRRCGVVFTVNASARI